MTAPERPLHYLAADRLRERLMDALEPVALQTPEGTSPKFGEALYVTHFLVNQAFDCPARASIDEPFTWRPALAARTITFAALPTTLPAGQPLDPPEVLVREALREAMADPDPFGFNDEFQNAPKAVRAQYAVVATAFMARLFNAMPDPVPVDLQLGPSRHKEWTFPNRYLRLRTRPDFTTNARFGKDTDQRCVWIMAGARGPHTRRAAAFEAVATTAASGSQPDHVAVVSTSTGLIDTYAIDDEFLQEGIDAAVFAAGAAIAGWNDAIDTLERRPGLFTCQGCVEQPLCTPYAEWEATPLLTRGGLPLL